MFNDIKLLLDRVADPSIRQILLDDIDRLQKINETKRLDNSQRERLSAAYGLLKYINKDRRGGFE